MDATALLQQQHDRMKQLFRDFDAAGESAVDRKAVMKALKAELAVHTFFEEEVFYPAVMRLRADEAKEAVRDALEEHHVVDGLVAELDALEPEDDQYDAKVAALRQSLERHMSQEEQAMFAQARIHLTDERLEKLGRQMAARRDSRFQPASLESRAEPERPGWAATRH
jgi:iron-sulfur cluster repair protein YtfE (RIC family)